LRWKLEEGLGEWPREGVLVGEDDRVTPEVGDPVLPELDEGLTVELGDPVLVFVGVV